MTASTARRFYIVKYLDSHSHSLTSKIHCIPKNIQEQRTIFSNIAFAKCVRNIHQIKSIYFTKPKTTVTFSNIDGLIRFYRIRL